MTTTYDPAHRLYLDEADVRNETARVFDVCLDCRACTDLCDVFPRIFTISDRAALSDAGHFTPSQQDEVIDLCHQCGLCDVNCPHAPRNSGQGVDFPRLVRRQVSMRVATGQIGLKQRLRMRGGLRRSESPENKGFWARLRIGRL